MKTLLKLLSYFSHVSAQTWEDDDQPLLDFAELAVLLSAISAAFVCESVHTHEPTVQKYRHQLDQHMNLT